MKLTANVHKNVFKLFSSGEIEFLNKYVVLKIASIERLIRSQN